MVSSGTVALHLAVKLYGLEKSWLVSPYCCTAVLSAIRAAGNHYYHLDDNLAQDISVPLFGQIDMAAQHSFIEDMSHGPRKQSAELAIASLGPTKAIRSTSGGIVSGKKNLIEKIKHLRECRDKPASGETLNLMPTEIDAALAHRSLENHEIDKAARHKTKQKMDTALIALQLHNEMELLGEQPYYYRYVVKLKNHLAADIAEKMKACGVEAAQPVWDYRTKPLGIEWADSMFDHALSLPFWSGMDAGVIHTVAEALFGSLD